MGNCFPNPKSDRSKYEENEDIPTHRVDSILLNSDEFISAISVCSPEHFALSQENTISLYSDFTCTQSWDCQDRIHCLTSDELFIYSGSKDIEMYSHFGKLQSTLSGHERPVNSISCRNNLLLSGGPDWSIRLWDIFTQQELCKNIINWNVVTCLKWVDDNIAVQTSEDLRLRIWDIREKRISKSAVISVGDNFATCVDVYKDFVITGHRGFSGNGCDVKLWDLRKNQEILVIKEHQQPVEAVLIAQEGLMSCAKDGKILIYQYDGNVIDQWVHPQSKPFITMQFYKDGLLAANIEPKAMFFSMNPLVNQF